MARPLKNNADYFSHDNDMRDDERIKAVRRNYSHTGYSVWNMLLERLCRAEDFSIVYNEESIDIMAGDFNLAPEELKSIIDYCVKLKLIVQAGDIIYSKTMLKRFEGLFRKRKRDSGELSLAITPQKVVIASDNTQSKVKNSKVNKRKEKEKEEKGNSEKLPPVVVTNFLLEEAVTVQLPEQIPIEKSCAKKVISSSLLAQCQRAFEGFAPHYIWEHRDQEQLAALLQKIKSTHPEISTDTEWINALVIFVEKLPTYWRHKKFTTSNLCANYNEIISEIRANSASTITKKTIAKTIAPTPNTHARSIIPTTATKY